MIVLDTSGILAAIDSSQRWHDEARRAIEVASGPLLLSPFVLAETDYLLATRVGVDQEVAFLREVAAGAYQLQPFGSEEVREAADLVERYRELGIGLADASLMVIAARVGTTRILTLDERHFRVLRPLKGGSFELLPRG